MSIVNAAFISEKIFILAGNDNGPFDFDENLAKAMEDLTKTIDGFRVC